MLTLQVTLLQQLGYLSYLTSLHGQPQAKVDLTYIAVAEQLDLLLLPAEASAVHGGRILSSMQTCIYVFCMENCNSSFQVDTIQDAICSPPRPRIHFCG